MIPDRAQFRDTHRYLAAVASEMARPALRAYARARTGRAPSTPDTWRRGVILGAGHIGDVLYRTCSLQALHEGLPGCRWTYATTAAGAELLHGNPALDDVIVVDGPGALPERLARERFDVALCSDNIEHHAGLMVALRARIPNRVAFGSKGLTGLATLAVPTPRASWPAQFQRMVRAVTGETPTWPLRPRVYLTDADCTIAERAWASLPFSDAPITIALAVTTRQRIGVFPLTLFRDVLLHVLAIEPRARLLLTGSAADQPALQDLAASVGPRAVIAGPLGLRAFVALLQHCDAFLGSDSGPRHMANAAGIPVFFVRNMAVPEIEAGRYCETETDLAPPGQYLSPAANDAALATMDTAAAATAIVTAARARRSHAALRQRGR